MKILINTASTFKGGGIQVALSFIEECKYVNDVEIHIIIGSHLSKYIDDSDIVNKHSIYKIDFRPAKNLITLVKAHLFFKILENKINPDVVFTTSGPAYWRPKAPHLTGYNLPHYIYDNSPYFNKLSGLQKLKWKLKGRVITHYFRRDADAWVVQTDDVNRRVRKLLGSENVFTVSNTCSRYYLNFEASMEETRDKLPERKPCEFRMLTLSAWYPHKNLSIIRDVIDSMPEKIVNNICFVLTIPAEIYIREFPERYRSRIINIGPVPPDEGPALYRECDALFLPTLLECFSASYAEAMAMELPILTSDLGFARSVCGDAALYFNPVDGTDITEKIIKLMESKSLWDELVKKGRERLKEFDSSEERAEKYLELCKKLVEDHGK